MMLGIIVWTISDILCVAILAVIAIVLLAHLVVESIVDAVRTVLGFGKENKKKGETK